MIASPGMTIPPLATNSQRVTPPSPMTPSWQVTASRQMVLWSFVALLALGLAWELWLAPLRPGGSVLAIKVQPLAVGLPGLFASRVRAFQGWSMGILAYLCEGLVRATSDRGPSVPLAWIETVLAAAAFIAILVHVRARRLAAAAAAAAASTPTPTPTPAV